MDAKAHVNIRVEYELNTPLHQAAEKGFAETVRKHRDQDFLTTEKLKR